MKEKIKRVFNAVKNDWFLYMLFGFLVAYFWVIVFAKNSLPGAKAEYYELEDVGRVVCVETWEAKGANHKKECVRFEPSQ